MTLWYVIVLVTNLTNVHLKSFTFTIHDSNNKNEFHIVNLKDNEWLLTLPKTSSIKTPKSIKFKIEKRTQLKTSIFKDVIDLNNFFELDKVDWKKVNEIRLKDAVVKKGETPIYIKRENNKIIINQNKGFLEQYKEIVVEW